MKSFWRLRPFTFAALGVSALMLGGCGANSEVGNNFQNVLANTARSILSARAYDRGKMAAQRQDQQGADVAFRQYMQLQREGADLTRLAEGFVAQGSQYDSQALQEPEGTAAKADLLRKSAEAYRRALTFSDGKFSSEDSQLLNSLGYFLAERGATATDFREAERLTRLSLAKYIPVEQQNGVAVNPDVAVQLNAMSRSNIRDSLAWSLYRQGKYDAAESEQMNALKTWRASVAALNTSDKETEAELTYHLAAIYAAHNRPTLARAGFQRALELRPLFPAALRGLVALEPSVRT